MRQVYHLHRLLFYCQVFSLIRDKAPLFPDPIEAWRRGPVIPSLRNRFPRGTVRYEDFRETGDRRKLSKDQKATIQTVMHHYKHYDSKILLKKILFEVPRRSELQLKKEIPLSFLRDVYAHYTFSSPDTDIIEVLRRIGKEIVVQDNWGSSDPYPIVQEHVKVYGFAEGYSEGEERINEDGDEPDPDEEDDEEKGIRTVGYRMEWQFVQAFLTTDVAQVYIEENHHRHQGKLRVYMESGHRNPQIQTIRDLLSTLYLNRLS